MVSFPNLSSPIRNLTLDASVLQYFGPSPSCLHYCTKVIFADLVFFTEKGSISPQTSVPLEDR